MKKMKLAILICLAFLLTGCIQKYELTDKQEDAAAEYMAGLLLEKDSDYKGGLAPVSSKETYEKLIDEGEISTIVNVNQSESNNNSDDTSNNNNSSSNAASTDTQPSVSGTEKASTDTEIVSNELLSNVIGKKDFGILYKNYHLYDTYPEGTTNTSFSLTSRNGNKLLVIAFSVKNLAGRKQKFDLSNSNISYKLDNNGTKLKPLLTLLENDLQYLDIDIQAEKSEEALLVFEVSNSDNVSKDKLIVSKGSKINVIELK